MFVTSEAKIAACRANGRRSKGPVTKEGREKSAMNALKFGLRSKKTEAVSRRLAQFRGTQAAMDGDG